MDEVIEKIRSAKRSLCIAMLGSDAEMQKANIELERALDLLEMREVARITIPGCPITKKNSQQIYINQKTKRPFITSSPQYKAYEEKAGYYIKYKSMMLSDRYNVRCVYYMPTRRRVDMVNLLEASCDILTHYGVIVDDHCGVVVSHDGSKVLYDKENPHVEITITEANP